jgi:hypothetical protein
MSCERMYCDDWSRDDDMVRSRRSFISKDSCFVCEGFACVVSIHENERHPSRSTIWMHYPGEACNSTKVRE